MPEVKIRMPGSAVIVTYASRVERDRSLLLAEARQTAAQAEQENPLILRWAELTDDERETVALEARDWVRAAAACGLIPERED